MTNDHNDRQLSGRYHHAMSLTRTVNLPIIPDFQDGAWTTGFYDSASGLFLGSVRGHDCDPRHHPHIGQQPEEEDTLRVTYDANVDAAYIYLVPETHTGGVDRTVMVDPREIDGMINLDFDKDGLLVGIEVLDASRLLSPELLRADQSS